MKLKFYLNSNILLLILSVIYPLYSSLIRLVTYANHKGYKENVFGEPDTFNELMINFSILLVLFIGCLFFLMKKQIGILFIRSSLLTVLAYFIIKFTVTALSYSEYINYLDLLAIIFITISLFNLSNKRVMNHLENKINYYFYWLSSIGISILLSGLLLFIYW